MFDPSAFVARCRGMIAAPDATIRDHVRPVPPWGVAAREHAVPLIVLTAAMSTVMIWLFPPQLLAAHAEAGLELLLLQFVMEIVVNFVGVAVISGVVMFFAGVFGGQATFNAAFVMVALASTPYLLAKTVVTLPIIGAFVFLAGLIYTLVLLYKAAPIALQLPWQNRGKHFAMSLLSLLMIAMLARTAFGPAHP